MAGINEANAIAYLRSYFASWADHYRPVREVREEALSAVAKFFDDNPDMQIVWPLRHYEDSGKGLMIRLEHTEESRGR